MSYTVLSRKWRPQTFEDVVGQSHITKILKNSIEQNKVSHAYLFSGPRGVGKTTIARIMSCNLNNVDTIEDSIDIIELDGASNRGIDEIREIKESVRYAPTEGKYKVFIIDESHMLTKEAFNALLKTLEEPPPNVLFILATTEYNKLPLTIISRCQRYAFKRISVNVMVDYLTEILSKEGFEMESKALKLIAYKADGSLRDSLSLLDKVITLCDDKFISDNITKKALGVIDEHEYLKILKAITNESFQDTFNSVEEILNSGISIINFIDGFNAYLKDIVYYYANYRKNISISADTVNFLKESKIDIQIASKLLNVNLEYLIKHNNNLSNISLENHFIKIFSYVNRHNESLSPTTKASANSSQREIERSSPSPNPVKIKSYADKNENIQAEVARSSSSPASKKVRASNNIDPKGLYSSLLAYFEKNDYKLYCVLIKCNVASYDNKLITITAQELTNYEQNSINMEMEKIGDVFNKIISQDLGLELEIKIAFDNMVDSDEKETIKDVNQKLEKKVIQEDSGDHDDHPLFDSVIDDLEGKLLK